MHILHCHFYYRKSVYKILYACPNIQIFSRKNTPSPCRILPEGNPLRHGLTSTSMPVCQNSRQKIRQMYRVAIPVAFRIVLQHFLLVGYISLMDKTESAFRENEQNITGDVYIGCGEHRSTFSIMQIIRSIQEEYPDIRFHFFSSNADAIIERLDKGLLDMGFLLEPEISPRYDYRKLPMHETWGILMRKDSPLAGKEEISFAELLRQCPLMPRKYFPPFSLLLSEAQPFPCIPLPHPHG